MSLNPDLKSINCTACGAGLDVLGGGRVTTHICSYCGTVLDALDEYQALQKFDLLNRPDSPFKIGMSGNLYGVDYKIIGILEHEERWGARRWSWVDHQLFSPTHGYAWLTLEDGHVTFSRRYRKPVSWLSEAQVELAEHRPTRRAGGQLFKYYETSTSSVIFAEGEFTWAPRKGEKTTTVSAISDQAMLSFSQTRQEQEIYHTVYLTPAELRNGFTLQDRLAPRGVHALQGFKGGKNSVFLMLSGLAAGTISVVLAFYMMVQNGTEVIPTQRLNPHHLPATFPFEVSLPGRLMRIDIRGNAQNSWGYLAVELEDPEGEVLFESGRTVEYYSGRDKDGSWSEGDNRASLAFFPPVAGTYQLTVDLEESEAWSGNGSYASRKITELELGLREGVSSGFWLIILALGFGIIGGLPLLRRYLHHKKRWHGSDWVDEDDD